MPQYCCVPQCKSKKGGHLFPADARLRLMWRVAIRRTDPQTKKLWQPGLRDRVCADHFVESDFKSTLTGTKY